MPNDCVNKLIIKGNHEDIKCFVTNHIRVNSDDRVFFDFNTIIPEPKTPNECDSKYVMQNGETRGLQLCKDREWFNWYDWRVANWNTKWGAYDCCITENYDCLIIDYCTAWTPSIPIIKKIIEVYPNLVFDYSFYECGCLLGGAIIGHNGCVTAEYQCDSIKELDEFAIQHGFEEE